MDQEFDRKRAQYEIYRDYMKHEDDLLNHRSTWHNVLQGFLFAALAATWSGGTRSEVLKPLHERMPIILAFLGTGAAFFAFLSTLAANLAILKLGREWKREVEPRYESALPMLPGLAGAQQQWVVYMGMAPALLIPLCIGAAWIYICITAFRG